MDKKKIKRLGNKLIKDKLGKPSIEKKFVITLWYLLPAIFISSIILNFMLVDQIKEINKKSNELKISVETYKESEKILFKDIKYLEDSAKNRNYGK